MYLNTEVFTIKEKDLTVVRHKSGTIEEIEVIQERVRDEK